MATGRASASWESCRKGCSPASWLACTHLGAPGCRSCTRMQGSPCCCYLAVHPDKAEAVQGCRPAELPLQEACSGSRQDVPAGSKPMRTSNCCCCCHCYLSWSSSRGSSSVAELPTHDCCSKSCQNEFPAACMYAGAHPAAAAAVAVSPGKAEGDLQGLGGQASAPSAAVPAPDKQGCQQDQQRQSSRPTSGTCACRCSLTMRLVLGWRDHGQCMLTWHPCNLQGGCSLA